MRDSDKVWSLALRYSGHDSLATDLYTLKHITELDVTVKWYRKCSFIYPKVFHVSGRCQNICCKNIYSYLYKILWLSYTLHIEVLKLKNYILPADFLWHFGLFSHNLEPYSGLTTLGSSCSGSQDVYCIYNMDKPCSLSSHRLVKLLGLSEYNYIFTEVPSCESEKNMVLGQLAVTLYCLYLCHWKI